MEQPPKKKHKQTKHASRWLSLLLLGLVCAGGLFFWYQTQKETGKTPPAESPTTYKTLLAKEASEIEKITVTRSKGEGYTLLYDNGNLSVEGWPEFLLDADAQKEILEACAVIGVEDTVPATAQERETYAADFGLTPPAISVEVAWKDGGRSIFHLGNKSPLSNEYYFTLEGDPSLYLAAAGVYELFAKELSALHAVTQPVIHQQRIDRITVSDGSGSMLADLQLQSDITAKDSFYAWQMTAPYQYPCNAEAMETLTSSIASIYLGSYAAPVTEENLLKYGLAAPQRILTVHQAAGQMAAIGDSGAYETTDYPESTFTLKVGAPQNDFVNYCQVDDKIYLVSNLSAPLLKAFDPHSYLVLQPGNLPYETLASLSISQSGSTVTYTLRREEQVLKNNELATDESGNVLYDTFVDASSGTITPEDFSARFANLQAITVSGLLPGDFKPEGQPSLTVTLSTVDGRTRSIALFSFDSLHDAVAVNGVFTHYLLKGELEKALLP